MNIWDIVVGLLVVLVLFFAVRTWRRNQKSGGCAMCGGGCPGGSNCRCKDKKREPKETEE